MRWNGSKWQVCDWWHLFPVPGRGSWSGGIFWTWDLPSRETSGFRCPGNPIHSLSPSLRRVFPRLPLPSPSSPTDTALAPPLPFWSHVTSLDSELSPQSQKPNSWTCSFLPILISQSSLLLGFVSDNNTSVLSITSTETIKLLLTFLS